jgi:hypothetical protein
MRRVGTLSMALVFVAVAAVSRLTRARMSRASRGHRGQGEGERLI